VLAPAAAAAVLARAAHPPVLADAATAAVLALAALPPVLADAAAAAVHARAAPPPVLAPSCRRRRSPFSCSAAAHAVTDMPLR